MKKVLRKHGYDLIKPCIKNYTFYTKFIKIQTKTRSYIVEGLWGHQRSRPDRVNHFVQGFSFVFSLSDDESCSSDEDQAKSEHCVKENKLSKKTTF